MEGVLYTTDISKHEKKDLKSVLTIGMLMNNLLKLMHQRANPYCFEEVN
jgi:hypothetical protein